MPIICVCPAAARNRWRPNLRRTGYRVFSEIAIVAKGKHDLLVPTGDGVREPQNRRVTIVYGGGATS